MTQPDVVTGPCRSSWDPTYPCPLPIGSETVSGIALDAAIDMLWSFSGRRFGLCERTVRPCRRECWDAGWWPPGWSRYGTGTGEWGWPNPALVGGVWVNLACLGCGDGCSCNSVSEALLPGPVQAVDEVKIDGVVLTPGVDYRVDNARSLVRLGGEDWPLCNDLNLDDDQVGTWSVTIQFGTPLPALGQLALGVLTIEFIKMLMCDETCALPKQVQSISRQGVSITFLDPQQVFQNGQTGLYLPDLFIRTFNPSGITRRARVFSLDGEQNRRLIDTPPVP